MTAIQCLLSFLIFREPKHRNIFAILTLYVLRRWVPSAGGCHCVDGLLLLHHAGDLPDPIPAGLYLRGHGQQVL